MAAKSVTTAEIAASGFGANPDHGPVAMGTHDCSVYLSWIQSMGEVLMSADGNQLGKEAVQAYVGLILALSESAQELLERELAERRGR